MKISNIHTGDIVKLKDELLQYEANKRWVGVCGEVKRTCGSYAYVNWNAPWSIKDEVEEPIDFLQKVYE